MRLTGLLVAVLGLVAACTRDEVGECPAIAAGELVVTEFRGPQSDDADTLGSWVELYNASNRTLDLEGVKVRFRKKDGSSEVPIIVRRPVSIAAGAYTVLGLVPDDGLPSYIDYGFLNDFLSNDQQGFLPAAAVDVESCGLRIDRAVYDVLPKLGTYSFGGTPNVDNNDMPAMWCVNMTPAGTPQQANPPCP